MDEEEEEWESAGKRRRVLEEEEWESAGKRRRVLARRLAGASVRKEALEQEVKVCVRVRARPRDVCQAVIGNECR